MEKFAWRKYWKIFFEAIFRYGFFSFNLELICTSEFFKKAEIALAEAAHAI